MTGLGLYLRKRQVKAPKVDLADSGLLQALLELETAPRTLEDLKPLR